MEYKPMYEETRAFYEINRDGEIYIFIAGARHIPGKSVEEFFEVQNENNETMHGPIADEIIQFGHAVIG